MARTVWKFELTEMALQSVEMPAGAHLLCIAMQGETICVWALVDPTFPKVKREFVVAPTGGPPLPDDGMLYIGTVHGVAGWMVFHVFDLGEE